MLAPNRLLFCAVAPRRVSPLVPPLLTQAEAILIAKSLSSLSDRDTGPPEGTEGEGWTTIASTIPSTDMHVGVLTRDDSEEVVTTAATLFALGAKQVGLEYSPLKATARILSREFDFAFQRAKARVQRGDAAAAS